MYFHYFLTWIFHCIYKFENAVLHSYWIILLPVVVLCVNSSSLKGAWPLSGDSPQSIETHQPAPKHDTRAQAIMKQAQATLTNRYGTSNILTNARTWGVYVIYLDKVLEKLAEFGPSQAEKQPSIKELMVYGKKQLRVKIRKLQVPFIKVEDQSRQYRPLVKEFKEWPLPDFDSPVGTCPFDTPRERRDQEPKKRYRYVVIKLMIHTCMYNQCNRL